MTQLSELGGLIIGSIVYENKRTIMSNYSWNSNMAAVIPKQ